MRSATSADMPRQKSTHVDDPLEVGRRLREAREAAAVSQRQLAFPGCSPAYISRIEAGGRIPSLQILRELGARLGVDADYLATGSADADSAILDAEIALRLQELDQAELGLDAALEDATGKRRVRVLTGLGEVAYRRGDVEEAIMHFETALAEAGGSPVQHPSLAEGIGRAYASAGRVPEAIAIFRQCVSQQQVGDDAVQTVRFACLLGHALTENDELDEAERVVASALEWARDISDPHTRARGYWSQARLLAERGRVEDASSYARMAHELLQTTDDARAIARAHRLLAHVYIDAGKLDRADAELTAGRRLIDGTSTAADIAHFEVEEARLLAVRGDLDRARALATKVCEQLSAASPEDAGRTYVMLGEVFETVGELERSVETYERAIEQLEKLPSPRYLLTAQRRMAAVLEQLDRPDLALSALKKAFGVQERLASPKE